ncbi:lysM and putative peptidoglycan-binding domain-containing protein 1-like isoform X2 [Xenia sp. Carnegie-2017]|uniref:lysM and putative peptidoglycan-binding domain-containing protein 1-like isoform X2 n=1 Tax=Xenia sp. Carnegie-2017 TaxID=2897299 RepID=UPI001F04E249|nr:lysM and putative peptidoglycan-binding domain-containing protein 1-like isoform X2 [Xenia sp. Carnegie-2017]
MEAEGRQIKETSSLSQSRKGPKTCYGATRKPESNTTDFKLVAHQVLLNDTLQGLAIKYGVTVEQIRRVNKLWINDNIHTYKTVYIPVKLEFINGNLNNSQLRDSEESVDAGVHEEDVKIDRMGHSNDKRTKKKNGYEDHEDSLKYFLKKLDVQMKTSITAANKQKAKGVPDVIKNIKGVKNSRIDLVYLL